MSHQTSATTSATGTIPSGVQVGEVILAHIVYRSVSITVSSVPSGWSLVLDESGGSGPGFASAVYRRTVDGTEGLSVTFTLSSTVTNSVAVSRFSGTDSTSTPIDNSSKASTSASVNSVLVPGFTTVTNDCAIIMFESRGAATTFDAITGFSERYDATSGSSTAARTLAMAETSQGAAGPTGDVTIATAGASATLIGILVALKSPGVPPAAPTGLTATVGTTGDL